MSEYNRFAGQNLDRLTGLSDGIFGVAMTLLVLDLRSPVAETIHSDADLSRALLGLLPSLLTYFMSFLTAGIFWINHQTQLNQLERSDRNFAWIQIAFLFTVTLLPFTTGLLSKFITYRTALIVYWFNILLLGIVLYLAWLYALRMNLTRPGITKSVDRAIRRRILFSQGLYAVGALLCIFSTYLSIGFLVLVQLNYAVAPFLNLGNWE